MHCRFCQQPMRYIHGHGACINNQCPLFGQNQAECCDGEQACNVPASTSQVAGYRPPGAPPPKPKT